MAWQRFVEPTDIYEQWERVAELLDPAGVDRSGFDAEKASEAVLSLLSGRRSLWAATCLTIGYASREDVEVGRVVEELAASPLDPWPTSDLTAFCAERSNLGWSPAALVSSARVVSSAILVPALAEAAADAGQLQICLDRYWPDRDRVLDCVRNAGAFAVAQQPQTV